MRYNHTIGKAVPRENIVHDDDNPMTYFLSFKQTFFSVEDDFKAFRELVKAAKPKGHNCIFLNYKDNVINTFQDVADYRHKGPLYNADESYLPELIIVVGSDTPPADYSSDKEFCQRRQQYANRILSRQHFAQWYWQLGWDIDQMRTEDTIKYFAKYISKSFAAEMNAVKLDYRHTLSMKHFMSLHDAYYGSSSLEGSASIHYRSNRADTEESESLVSIPKLQHDNSTILMLEDDAIFVPHFKARLADLIKKAPQNEPWMIWVGSCGNRLADTKGSLIVDHTILLKHHGSYPAVTRLVAMPNSHKMPDRCTHAYALNRLGVRVLLDRALAYASTGDWRPSDLQIRALLITPKGKKPTSKLINYWVEPPMSYQGNKARMIVNGTAAMRG